MSIKDPVSFKDANFWKQFKSKSGGPLTPVKPVVKPLPPPQSGLVLTPEFQAEQARKKKEMVAFVNQLRCPICKTGQFDGEASTSKASVYCRIDPDHYAAEYNAQKQLKSYTIKVSFNARGYTITGQVITPEQANIVVYVVDRTIDYDYQQRYRKELFRFTGSLPDIDFTLSEDDFLAEIRLFALLS